MTPSYDLIVDNPMETAEDLAATLDFLYRMPRPFILNVFPLMVIPGTELAAIAAARALELPGIKQGQASNSYANALVIVLSLWRPPRRVYQAMRRRLLAHGPRGRVDPVVMMLLLSALNLKRALSHIRYGHLAVLPTAPTWVLWRIGLVRLLNRRTIRACSTIDPPRSPSA